MNVTFIYVGSLKDQWIRDGVSEFDKRLGKYCKVTNIELKQEKLDPDASEKQILAAIEREGDAILARLPDKALKIALAVEGKLYSSEELASLMEGAREDVVFIIGGTHGLSERVKRAANVRLSVSKMTFPHRLMRIIIGEQVYRAFNINAGSHYHQ